MKRLRTVVVAFVILTACAVAAAIPTAGDWQRDAAIRDSLRHVPPKWRGAWLRERDIDWPGYTSYRQPDTGQGLRMVGKYGRGPSGEVTGRDTLVFVCLGSELAIVSVADVGRPRVIAELQLDYLPHQAAVRDSILLTCGNGLDIWSISDPGDPVHLATIPYAIGDFVLLDTLVYFIGADTFLVYDISNPASPRRLGSCPDSGNVTASNGSVAVVLDGNSLDLVDVSTPSAPHQAGSWTGWALSAAVRGNLCYATFSIAAQQSESWFLVLDVSNPASPVQVGRCDSVCGHDIYLADSLALVSGRDDAYEEFRIVSIADSSHPRRKGTCYVWNDNWGVWADPVRNRAYIASEPSGLAVVDITDQNAPFVDTLVLTADLASDVWLDGTKMYVADYRAGIRIVDVADPTRPVELGGIDSLQCTSEAVAARDSFAFAGWSWSPYLRSLLVSDPSQPEFVGGGGAETKPMDMVLRDTLLYLAGRLRFNVINVARPREPVLVGSCAGDGVAVVLQDSFAYTAAGAIRITNVARPDSPFVVTTLSRASYNLSIDDSMLFIAPGPIVWYDLSSPTAPVVLDSIDLGHSVHGLAAVDGVVYASTVDGLAAIDVRDVHNPRVFAQTTLPYVANRIVYAPPRLYATCWDAGVCILDTVAAGVAERQNGGCASCQFQVRPNPTLGTMTVTAPATGGGRVSVWDATGRMVAVAALDRQGRATIDIGDAPCGLYFVETHQNGIRRAVKVAKQ